MKFSLGNAQHIGDRSEQQDSFGFSDPLDSALVAHGGIAAVVADGMGGLANGGAASSVAVQAFLKAYAAKRSEESIPDALLRCIRTANQAVMTLWHQAGARESLGSTLAAVALHRDWLYWVSAGDSRVYLLRDGQITRLTTDHIYAADLEVQVGKGRITREEANHHPEREALTSYLGLESLPHVDRSVRAFPIQPGDYVLICSDGLYRALSEEDIAAALQKDAGRTCESLIEHAIGKKLPGQDNITALALRCQEESRISVPVSKLVPAAAVTALAALGFLYWRESAPSIQTFAADRAKIQAGQSVTLTWSVDRGRVTITPDIGEIGIGGGARTVRPSRPIRYTLEARNAFWTDRRTVDVDVLPPPALPPNPIAAVNNPPARPAEPAGTAGQPGQPVEPPPALPPVAATPGKQPVVEFFTATPRDVAAGKPAILKWSVKNANLLRLVPSGGTTPLQAKGSRSVNPTTTTTYTLTATAKGKAATATVVVTVAPSPKPAVQIAFTSDKAEITSGDIATLTWNVTGDPRSIVIDNGIGPVKAAGARKVSPTSKTTYRLSAAEPGGAKLTAAVKIDVLATPKPDTQPPKIVQFEAFSDGDNWRLRWQITATDPAATKVTIEPDINVSPGLTSPAEGVQLPSPPADHYTLIVVGPGGVSVTKQISVPPQLAAQR